MIGDPKQAIYAFRGADVHTYLRARASIESAGGPCLHLEENFRSSAPLIEAYNAILDQAAPFFRPEGGILYDHPVSCGRPELALARPAAFAPVVVLDVETQHKELLTWQVKRALLARLGTEVRDLLAPGGASGRPGAGARGRHLRPLPAPRARAGRWGTSCGRGGPLRLLQAGEAVRDASRRGRCWICCAPSPTPTT